MAQLTANLEGEIIVAETMLTVLRGLRVSTDSAVAQAAIQRERVLERQLIELQRQSSEQPELLLAASAHPADA